MTDSDTKLINEVRERLAKATPGPWRAEFTPAGAGGAMCYSNTVNALDPDYLNSAIEIRKDICAPVERITKKQVWENMALIAHAPSDLAALLDLCERLSIQKDGLEKWRDQLFSERSEKDAAIVRLYDQGKDLISRLAKAEAALEKCCFLDFEDPGDINDKAKEFVDMIHETREALAELRNLK